MQMSEANNCRGKRRGKELTFQKGVATDPASTITIVGCSSYPILPPPHSSKNTSATLSHHNTMIRDAKHSCAWLFLLLSIVQRVTWVTAASARPFSHSSQAQTPLPLHGRWVTKEHSDGWRAVEGEVVADRDEEINRLGSRPPSCRVKCGGCKPCVAVQVPTPANHAGVQQQYTNYEPEGWRCKCGSVFFNP